MKVVILVFSEVSLFSSSEECPIIENDADCLFLFRWPSRCVSLFSFNLCGCINGPVCMKFQPVAESPIEPYCCDHVHMNRLVHALVC